MNNAFVDTLNDTDVMEARPSVDEVLDRWKARVDAYQYDPNKKQHYISLEEYGNSCWPPSEQSNDREEGDSVR